MKTQVYFQNLLITSFWLLLNYIVIKFIYSLLAMEFQGYFTLSEAWDQYLTLPIFLVALYATSKELNKKMSVLYETNTGRLIINSIALLLLMWFLDVFPLNTL